MKIKTQNLTGPALDWAVAKCLALTGVNRGFAVIDGQPYVEGRHGANGGLSGAFYSRDWSQGGPIMERERICITYPRWDGQATALKIVEEFEDRWEMHGPTPLIAAMRAYVASKMGAEVEVPDELV